ncbi:MAG TPA: RNHCP domain-containing protein [Symbiobacteriaceae bacterium]|nr:RNHCP domain-containing protein [Symbiobacteriaceae bacterium]
MLKNRTYVGSGNAGFTCEYCGAAVPPVTNGSYRNHCPFCLHSKHVDEAPGDRSAGCKGLMVPIALTHNGRKGYQVVHRCMACGAVRRNRVVESGLAPDDLDQLCALSAAAPTM